MLKKSCLTAIILSLLQTTTSTASNQPDCFDHSCTTASGYSEVLLTAVQAETKRSKGLKFRDGVFFGISAPKLPLQLLSADKNTVFDNLAIRVSAGMPLFEGQLMKEDEKGVQRVRHIRSIQLAQSCTVGCEMIGSYHMDASPAEHLLTGFTVYLSGTSRNIRGGSRGLLSATYFRPAVLPWLSFNGNNHVHLQISLRDIIFDAGYGGPIMNLALKTKIDGQDVPAEKNLYTELFKLVQTESDLLTPIFPVIIEMGNGKPKTDRALIVRQITDLTDEMVEVLNREHEVQLDYRETGIPMAQVVKLTRLSKLTMALSDFTPENFQIILGMKRLPWIRLNAFPTNVPHAKEPKFNYDDVFSQGNDWLAAHPLLQAEQYRFRTIFETNDY